jgi:hypothetical protein
MTLKRNVVSFTIAICLKAPAQWLWTGDHATDRYRIAEMAVHHQRRAIRGRGAGANLFERLLVVILPYPPRVLRDIDNC